MRLFYCLLIKRNFASGMRIMKRSLNALILLGLGATALGYFLFISEEEQYIQKASFLLFMAVITITTSTFRIGLLGKDRLSPSLIIPFVAVLTLATIQYLIPGSISFLWTFFLGSFTLLLGMSVHSLIVTSEKTKWIRFATIAVTLSISLQIMFKVDSPLLYLITTLLLGVISLLSIIGLFFKPSN